jgi:hypothetical protein
LANRVEIPEIAADDFGAGRCQLLRALVFLVRERANRKALFDQEFGRVLTGLAGGSDHENTLIRPGFPRRSKGCERRLQRPRIPLT